MNKNLKAMLNISDVLDDRYEKLCDRYHELELSHNRKKRALKQVIWQLDRCEERGMTLPFDISYIYEICNSALFSDGRLNERIKK